MMEFTHETIDLGYKDLVADTRKSGRTYHTPDGSYPSITTILGKTSDQTWLLKWKERVGEEEATRVSKIATDRGTLVHEYAERHFNGEDIWDELYKEAVDVIQMSRDLVRATEKGVEEIWGQEQVLWSNKYYADSLRWLGFHAHSDHDVLSLVSSIASY